LTATIREKPPAPRIRPTYTVAIPPEAIVASIS
jgi:hypothetical protein